MQVLIFGAGVLGKRVARTFAGDHGHREVTTYTHAEADITDAETVSYLVAKHNPDVVLNAAAKTDVDWCESNPHEALRVNAVGAGIVAAACIDRPLVHISTDFVFQGNNGPYTANDIPYPIQAYGSSKWMGEQAVRAIHPRHVIIRLGWLYGVEYPTSAPMLAFTQSYSQDVTIRDRVKSRNVRTKAVSRAAIWGDLAGTPTFVGHAALRISGALSTAAYIMRGQHTVHLGPQEAPISWYDLLVTHFPTIRRTTSQQRAQRPKNGGLVPTPGFFCSRYDLGIAEWLLECDQAGLRTGTP
jgi:dTDP-4-dehydrorhamnose reductase